MNYDKLLQILVHSSNNQVVNNSFYASLTHRWVIKSCCFFSKKSKTNVIRFLLDIESVLGSEPGPASAAVAGEDSRGLQLALRLVECRGKVLLQK